MIEKNNPSLSVGAQCHLLSISRSSFYHAPQGETAMNLGLMRLIDQQFLDTPFYGIRPMICHLQNEEHTVNQKRIRRLMRLMRMRPIYRSPTQANRQRGTRFTLTCWADCGWSCPTRAWCADITYLPIRRRSYPTRDAARQDVFDYIELFYNPKRKHTNNGILSPVDFEDRQQKLTTAGVQETRGTSYICKVWTSEPDRFILDPIHQMPGLNTLCVSGLL